MIEIWQLTQNKHYDNLQSWKKRRTTSILADDLDPLSHSIQDIQDNLEFMFCKEDCMHRFKMKTESGTIESPDLFDTKWLGRR